jgi:hypothetical protein
MNELTEFQTRSGDYVRRVVAARAILVSSECLHDVYGSADPPLYLRDGHSGLWLAPAQQMLRGMAIENLIKAVILKQGDEPKPIHKLLDLWESARLGVVSEMETELLERLTTAIEWWGRYPAPRTEQRLMMDRKRQGTCGNDHRILCKLWQRLEISLGVEWLAGLAPLQIVEGRRLWHLPAPQEGNA